jgi:lipid-A-disaccharide synthase
MERLTEDTPQQRAMLAGFEDVWQRLTTTVPAGKAAAGLVLELLEKRKGASALS